MNLGQAIYNLNNSDADCLEWFDLALYLGVNEANYHMRKYYLTNGVGDTAMKFFEEYIENRKSKDLVREDMLEPICSDLADWYAGEDPDKSEHFRKLAEQYS